MTTKNAVDTLEKIPDNQDLAENITISVTNALTSKKSPKKKVEVPVAEKKVRQKKIATPAAIPGKKIKNKVVRDSFTMPHSEYQKITTIKDRCLKAGQPVKKSEVLRAGLNALCAMDDEQLKLALAGLEKIKTGRPRES